MNSEEFKLELNGEDVECSVAHYPSVALIEIHGGETLFNVSLAGDQSGKFTYVIVRIDCDDSTPQIHKISGKNRSLDIEFTAYREKLSDVVSFVLQTSEIDPSHKKLLKLLEPLLG